jgi:hypothetical protein
MLKKQKIEMEKNCWGLPWVIVEEQICLALLILALSLSQNKIDLGKFFFDSCIPTEKDGQ